MLKCPKCGRPCYEEDVKAGYCEGCPPLSQLSLTYEAQVGHERAAAEWMRENPEIMQHFEKLALEAAARDKRFGIGALTEVVRWEINVRWQGEFKINNNHRAYIARELIRRHPHLERYVETRKVRG